MTNEVQARRPAARAIFTARRRKATAASASTRGTSPTKIVEGLGIPDIDREGRYIRVDFGNLSVISVYQPSGSSGEERQQVKFSFMKRFFPHLKKLARRRPRNRAVRRLEHRAQGNRPQELARQPEELGLPARRARVADARLRRARLGRHVPLRRLPARPVHVVVEPRPGVGEERRVAHRLPDRDAGARGRGEALRDLQGPALLRPRAAHDRLRLHARVRADAP